MQLYIKNKSFETIALIDEYTSVIWTKRYFTCGDFELYLPVTSKLLEILAIGNYVYRLDDDEVMVIEKIEITTDAETGNYLIVSGRSLGSIIGRRIVWNMTSFDMPVGDIIKYLLNANVINPTITERKIDNFSFIDNTSSSQKIQKQITGDNLLTAIETLCTTYGYGWKVKLIDNSFEFELYEGTDRSYNQAANPYVVFSPEFDNLINSKYNLDSTTFANVALVAGEGEGVARKRQSVGNASGLDRYEIYVEANDMSTNSEETISASQYETMLKERGLEKLAEATATEAFEGDVESTYAYKTDWNIGDIVQIENEFGITATSRIIEVIEAEDASGHKIIPTFEKWEV
jgi:hypothetical protein